MLAFALSVLVWDEHDVARIVSTYKPLRKHPALFDAKAGWNRWIEPRLLDALEELKTGNESAVRSLLRVEVEGSDASVYSFAIFTTDFCDRFIEELLKPYDFCHCSLYIEAARAPVTFLVWWARYACPISLTYPPYTVLYTLTK